ncbi:MAG: FAD-dependent oxidoreductase, partial [Pseudomonadota bacterium]
MYDVVIVGAGIVGLATAAALRNQAPDLRLCVIDKEDGPARHQTGRNSGVIHAGLYYKPSSLKARFCAAGVQRTIDFCERHGVAYEQCGKLVVATD